MRLIAASLVFLVSLSGISVAASIESDHLDLSRIEAVSDRVEDTWRGRQHFLYDNDNTAKTDGAAMAAENACAKEFVRVRRADGKTSTKPINRCD